MNEYAEYQINSCGTWTVTLKLGSSTFTCVSSSRSDLERQRSALIRAYDTGRRDAQAEIRSALGIGECNHDH